MAILVNYFFLTQFFSTAVNDNHCTQSEEELSMVSSEGDIFSGMISFY